MLTFLAIGPAPAQQAMPPLDTAARDWVERTLSKMTVAEMAAQVIVAWVPGSYVSTDSDGFERYAAMVERGVGGIWLMGGLPHARAAKANALQARAKIPLIVSADPMRPRRDGRILGGATDWPSQLAHAAAGDLSEVRESGRMQGLEARATGAHVLLGGPEVNVLLDFDNVLINRTFGDDPEQVGRLSAAFIDGAQEAGVLTVGGFFPGAGDLNEDPHVVLPVLRADRTRLDSVEFVPFRHAIGAGVDQIMTSHFAAPGLTGSETLPATLSPEVIRVLREDLGYGGLVITDAFDMGALTDNYRHLDAVIRAFKAGHDLLLGPAAIAVADTLTALVENGAIPVERLRASVRRILEAKARIGLHQERYVSLDRVAEVVGRRSHQEAADALAERSIVLLRDRDGLVPLRDPPELRVLSVTLDREENETAGAGFDGVLRSRVKSLDRARVVPSSEPTLYDDILRRARNADHVILSVYLEPRLGVVRQARFPGAFADLVQRLQAEGRSPVVLTFGYLRVLDPLPDLGTFLLAWSGQEVMQRAAARALLGITPVAGRLPVSLPPHHRNGEGLTRDAGQKPFAPGDLDASNRRRPDG